MEVKEEHDIIDGFKLVSDENNIIIVNNSIYLLEWKEYKVLSNNHFNIKVNDGKKEIPVRKEINDYYADLKFENNIGYSDIKINDNSMVIQILSKKVGEIYGLSKDDYKGLIDKHEELYNNIVGYIYERLSVLPFSISSITYFYAREDIKQTNTLFTYYFLKNNIDRIKETYEQIIRMPYRKLEDERVLINIWEASNVDEDTIIDIISNNEYLTKSDYLKIVNEYTPEKVFEKRLYDSYDNLENRFVKYFLEELLLWCDEIIKTYNNNKIDLKDIINAKDMLIDYLNNPIFADVKSLDIIPYNSQVLQKREGYKDAFMLWLSFKAYSPFFEALNNAIDNKDIATLYEYYCFFKLIEELDEFNNAKLNIDYEPTGELKENVYASIGQLKIYYNKEFKNPNSYSIPVKPDFSIYLNNELIGVFDAKFRLTSNELEPKDNDNDTFAKSADIYKMHAYRDALKVRFAVILYPGDKSRFFSLDGNKNDKIDIKNIIDMEGIGYLGTRRWFDGR